MILLHSISKVTVLFLISSFLLNCSLPEDTLAGGASTEVGNPEISETDTLNIQGTVYSNLGIAVKTASVTLIPEHAIPLIDTTYYTTNTDSLGVYQFSNIPYGNYTLFGVSLSSSEVFFRNHISILDTTTQTLADTLNAGGTISIVLPDSITSGFVYIPRTPLYHQNYNTDTLIINNVPTNRAFALIWADTISDTSILLDSFTVTPNTLLELHYQKTTIDPVDSNTSIDSTTNDTTLIEPIDTVPNILVVIEFDTLQPIIDQPYLTALESQSISYNLISSKHILSQEDTTDIDAIVILPSALSTNMTTRYRDIQKPILIMEAWLQDDMGLTGTVETQDYFSGTPLEGGATQIKIKDSSHDAIKNIASPAEISTTPFNLSWGIPSQTATLLATEIVDTHKSLFYYYESDTMMYSMKAPDIRVALLFSETMSPYLTPTAIELFKSAVLLTLGEL
ncbi:MAG: hypothetical protein OCD76_09490 [Reichenbachiella sp.]